jgi:predicted ATPase
MSETIGNTAPAPNQNKEETLIIKNFGPILHCDLVIKRFTILIGKQSSGKSTIAKVLAMLRNPEALNGFIDNASLDFSMEKMDDYFGAGFRNYEIQNYLKTNSFIEYKSSNYSITLKNSQWSINLSEEVLARLTSERKRVRDLVHAVMMPEARPEKIEDLDREDYSFWIKSFGLEVFSDLSDFVKKSVFIPADRILIPLISDAPFSNRDLLLPDYLKDFIAFFEAARRTTLQFKLNFLELTYRFENNENVIFQKGDVKLLLRECSSGVQSIIPLYVVVDYYSKTGRAGDGSPLDLKYKQAFIVEEPELSLYPTTQKELVYFLVSSCNTNKTNDLLITTHSPYILSALNNMLFAFVTTKKHPERAQEINEIVDQVHQINPDEFEAYYVADGEVRSIFNTELGLISDNEIDSISENILEDYNSLFEIYKS